MILLFTKWVIKIARPELYGFTEENFRAHKKIEKKIGAYLKDLPIRIDAIHTSNFERFGSLLGTLEDAISSIIYIKEKNLIKKGKEHFSRDNELTVVEYNLNPISHYLRIKKNSRNPEYPFDGVIGEIISGIEVGRKPDLVDRVKVAFRFK